MVTTYLDMYSVRSDGATGSIVYSKPANGQLKAGVVPIKH
jgi:hypothetical protein